MGFGITTYNIGEGKGKAIGLLQAENSSLSQSLNFTEEQTTLGVNSFRYKLFLDPAKAIDNAIITTFETPLNSKKSSIAGIGDISTFESHPKYYSSISGALAAVETMYGAPGYTGVSGGTEYGDGVVSERATYVNLNIAGSAIDIDIASRIGSISVGAVITQSGGASGVLVLARTAQVGVDVNLLLKEWTGTFSAGAATTVFVAGIAFTNNSLTNYAGIGTMYKDIIISERFPNLEPPNPSANNPTGNVQYDILSGSTNGIGAGLTFHPNCINAAYDDFVYSDDTLPVLGTVLAFDGVSNSSGLSNITSLRAEIKSLRGINSSDSNVRTGIASFVGAGSTVRTKKTGFARNIWSLEYTKKQGAAQISNNNTAISILSDPAFGGPY